MTRFFLAGVLVFLLGLGIVNCEFSAAVEPQISTEGSSVPEDEETTVGEMSTVGASDEPETNVDSTTEEGDTLTIVETTPGHHDEIGMFPLNMTTTPLRCGEFFNTSTNIIFYKAFENVLEHERCVWTIAHHGAVGYKVNVQYLGQNSNPNLNRLVITGFAKGGNQSEQIVIPTTTGEITIVSVDLLVIVFHTGAIASGKNDTGFALQYSTISSSDASASNLKVNLYNHQQISWSSRHYMSPSPTFNLQHPVQNYYKSLYTSNELTSFVFVPKNNVFHADHKTTLVYKKDSLETNSCADRLDVYFFCPKTNSWDHKGKLCDDSSMQLIRNNDITLIIFQSDQTTEGNGFQFIYM